MTTVKTLLTLSLLLSTRLAAADETETAAPAPAAPVAALPVPAMPAEPATPAVREAAPVHSLVRPDAKLLHGFRIGGMMITNLDKPTRTGDDGTMTSLKDEFGIKSKYMMLIGYEGMYRVMSRSWLNVILVGNVTVAGLEQSKFIPAASGLLGFEIDRAFQLGVGVNLTPDPQSPTHMIAAAGWTPKVGSINTPVHFFFVPDTEGNHRMGATIGMSW